MPRKLDMILVVDVEATCWKEGPPRGEESEIIEIGLCTLDVMSGERVDRESILIRPQRSRVSAFCTELTTLTQEQVDQGITFPEACAILENRFLSRMRVWASFGDYDRLQFERQCRVETVPYPFGRGHVNVKTLLALIHALPREVGLTGALELLDLPLEGTHHRGGDDAWNIAAVLSQLLLQSRSAWAPQKQRPQG